MPLVEKCAQSLAEVLESAREIRDAWNPEGDAPEEIWFRGQPHRFYTLLPGLYRPSVAVHNYEEYTLLRAFENLGAQYTAHRPENAWEWYFLSGLAPAACAPPLMLGV